MVKDNARGDRIRKGLAALGRKQKELAEKLKIDDGFLSGVIEGTRPGKKHLPGIAKYLGTTVEWIITGTGAAPTWAEAAGGAGPWRSISIAGKVAAGDGDVEWWQDRPRDFAIPITWTLMQVEGSSGYPVVWDQQHVIVDTSGRRPHHNDLVVVQCSFQGRQRSFLKRYCLAENAPDGFVLSSIDVGKDSPYVAAKDIIVMIPVVGVLFESGK